MACKRSTFTACALALAGAATHATAAGLDLSNYRLSAVHQLPAGPASEASAVTWNWDTDTLFVVGDEGESLVEVDKQGRQLSTMRLSGFDDTEGVTYVGNGQFIIAEERVQRVSRLTYAAGGAVNRGTLQSVTLGDTVGNVGVEGLSFDPRSGEVVVVKEKSPQALYTATLTFAGGAGTTQTLFTPGLGVLDLADVQVLSTVPSLRGTVFADHLLVFSQESALLMTVTRQGQILSRFDFSSIGTDIEGVTIDDSGTIFLVGETPALYVLSPVPEPQTIALAVAGLALVGWTRRGRRTA